MQKQPTEKQLAARKAFGEAAKARAAAKTSNKNVLENQNDTHETKEEQPVATAPIAAQPQLITLTPEQLDTLVSRLVAGQITDKAPSPSMTAGVGLRPGIQTNHMGQIVGTEQKWDIDPNHYPNPIDRLMSEPRLRRFSMDDNYFLTWDITSKPYETKYGYSVQEPFFHMTLYMNMFDDQGEDTGSAIVVQTLHFNEDQQIAIEYAAELGIEVTADNLKEVMNIARYERAKRWLLAIFFPERNFQATNDAKEQAIGGQVVKVVTKSNVKGFGNPIPTITDEELQT
jgi:hypothetical protein